MARAYKTFQLRKVLVVQWIIGLLLSLGLIVTSQQAALSCLAAVVLAGVVNTSLLVWYFKGRQNAAGIVFRLYSGEVIKILFLAFGVIVLAQCFDLKWWAFILGLVVMQLSYCVIPYFMYQKGTVTL